MVQDGWIGERREFFLDTIDSLLAQNRSFLLLMRTGATDAFAEYEQTFANLSNTLSQCLESDDPEFLLAVERRILEYEHDELPQLREALRSSLAALNQVADVETALEKRKENPREYHEQSAVSHPSSRKQGGLPLDTCRHFASSHALRLGNRLTNSYAMSESNGGFIRRRIELARHFRGLYIDWQREFLEDEEDASLLEEALP